MDAAGFSVVDNRAGVTFGVELYMPCDAPEMATDLSAKGTVPLRNVQDVFGMCGRQQRCDVAFHKDYMSQLRAMLPLPAAQLAQRGSP